MQDWQSCNMLVHCPPCHVPAGAAPPVVLEVLHPSAARPAEGGEPVDELRLEWQAVSCWPAFLSYECIPASR